MRIHHLMAALGAAFALTLMGAGLVLSRGEPTEIGPRVSLPGAASFSAPPLPPGGGRRPLVSDR